MFVSIATDMESKFEVDLSRLPDKDQLTMINLLTRGKLIYTTYEGNNELNTRSQLQTIVVVTADSICTQSIDTSNINNEEK